MNENAMTRAEFTAQLNALAAEPKPNRKAMLDLAIAFCSDGPNSFDIHNACRWLHGRAGWSSAQWMAYYDRTH